MGVLAPADIEWALAIANRNFLTYQYDEINRQLTWITLAHDLPEWRVSLQPLFALAARAIAEEQE